jgi:ankyrin repeat protein
MANDTRPRRQKPPPPPQRRQQQMQKQPSHSSPQEPVVAGTHSHQRADNERKRILRSIMNDDANAVALWMDAIEGNQDVALLPDDPLNNSVMHMVAFKGKLSTLRMMWARGMKCNHRNHQGETALHWAVKCPDEAAMCAVILELVTIGDADVNAGSNHGDTPLSYAIADGNLAAVMELCERGASLLLLNSDGDSAIHLAIASGNSGVVAYVLEQLPLAAQMRDGLGRLPIQIALECGNEDIIQIVLLAWPLCLGCRTSEGILLHDAFPKLGLLHLIEGLGFGDECLWETTLGDSKEMGQFRVDVTVSGTTFYLEGHATIGSESFELQLNDLNWEFDVDSLSAGFFDGRGVCVMVLTANSLATHNKLLRQLDLARLSASSYASSADTGDNTPKFKVLNLKKSAVPDPADHSDSGKSVESGLIQRSTSVNDLSWLEKLDERDVDLMIKWGVVSPENAKAILVKRASRRNDGDIIRSRVNDRTRDNQEVPAAPPPRRKTKDVGMANNVLDVTSAPVPSAPPPRRAKGKVDASFGQTDASDSPTEKNATSSSTHDTKPQLLVVPALNLITSDFQDDSVNVEEPPPPPPLINYAKKCIDVEQAAVHMLQVALESGQIHSGFRFMHFCVLFLQFSIIHFS